jgi:hypothetical protein
VRHVLTTPAINTASFFSFFGGEIKRESKEPAGHPSTKLRTSRRYGMAGRA